MTKQHNEAYILKQMNQYTQKDTVVTIVLGVSEGAFNFDCICTATYLVVRSPGTPRRSGALETLQEPLDLRLFREYIL